MHLNRFFESQTGKYMFSIILGIGLASLFRKVCKDKNCIVLKPPPLDEIQNKVNLLMKKSNGKISNEIKVCSKI